MYIVDGVQVENALSVVSPQDIATIDSVSKQPFWRPTQVAPAAAIGTAPASGVAATKWVRIDWVNHLTTASAIDGKPLWQGLASYFTPGKSELLPFDQATIASYQGKLKQNPGY